MTGEEAELTEGIEEEMESMRRVEQRVAEFATRRAERTRPRRRPERPALTGAEMPRSGRINSPAGQERRTLRQPGGNPQRWRQPVERHDQHPALDVLEPAGVDDAQDRERAARAPAAPAARSHVAISRTPGDVLIVECPGRRGRPEARWR